LREKVTTKKQVVNFLLYLFLLATSITDHLKQLKNKEMMDLVVFFQFLPVSVVLWQPLLSLVVLLIFIRLLLKKKRQN
jgi:hypothetical protein